MVELADTPGLGPGGIKPVEVRVLFPVPVRNCQIRIARFGGLGDQIVGNFRRKNQLAVLF